MIAVVLRNVMWPVAVGRLKYLGASNEQTDPKWESM